jgi:hypothetical protein
MFVGSALAEGASRARRRPATEEGASPREAPHATVEITLENTTNSLRSSPDRQTVMGPAGLDLAGSRQRTQSIVVNGQRGERIPGPVPRERKREVTVWC